MSTPPSVFDIFDCQKAGIEKPGDGDILCGKDKTFNLHPGNLRFRQLIEAHAPAYARADSKQNKMKITKSIVDTIQIHGSRFLEKVDGSLYWSELANAKARDKTSHALRFYCKNHPTKQPRRVSNENGTVPMTSNDTMNSTDTMMREFASLYSSPEPPSYMEVDPSSADTIRSIDLLKSNADTLRSRDTQDLNLDTLRSQDLRDIMDCAPAQLGPEDSDEIMAMTVSV